MLAVGGVIRIYLDYGVRPPCKVCSLTDIVNKEMLVVGDGDVKTTHQATHSPTNQHPPACTYPPTMQVLFADAHRLTVTAILRIMVNRRTQ